VRGSLGHGFSDRFTDQDVTIFDIANQSRQHAMYADHQVRVTPWLIVNGGLRFDNYERFGRATPRAGVILAPSSPQSFKYLYGRGRAFRAPNEYELTRFSSAKA
jgi:outer membrane receptor protein involved in Fe transport